MSPSFGDENRLKVGIHSKSPILSQSFPVRVQSGELRSRSEEAEKEDKVESWSALPLLPQSCKYHVLQSQQLVLQGDSGVLTSRLTVPPPQ